MATEEEKKIAERKALQESWEKIGLSLSGKLVGHEVRKIYREMTTSELLDSREKYADLNVRIQDLEMQKQIAKQHYDGKIKPLAAECDVLLRNIRSKMHDIEDDCFVMFDYEASKVRYVSRVTLNVVEVREMTGDDRQQSLFDEESENQTAEDDGDDEE